MDVTPQDRQLLDAAVMARERSYCHYSGFAVGAALQLADGTVHTGCNVENASYGLTICAERSAVFAAVRQSPSAPEVLAVAIVAGPQSTSHHLGPVVPCGACLQVLAEFAGPECRIICADVEDNTLSAPRNYTLRELLPVSFGSCGDS